MVVLRSMKRPQTNYEMSDIFSWRRVLSRENIDRRYYCLQSNSRISFDRCLFGRSVTRDNLRVIADTINSAPEAGVDPDFIQHIVPKTSRWAAICKKASDLMRIVKSC